LLKKVFFPPQVLPTVTVMANFTNFLLGVPLLFGLLLLYGVHLRWTLLILPVIMGAQFALTLGLTLTVSAASVRYRDIPPILGHLLTFWFFLSPIIYPATQIPERFRSVVSLNPFAPFVVAYQDVLLYNAPPTWETWAGMTAASVLALGCGLLVFGRLRWSIVEEI
jgi:homopolymeric O-antigen transport system permease protein